MTSVFLTRFSIVTLYLIMKEMCDLPVYLSIHLFISSSIHLSSIFYLIQPNLPREDGRQDDVCE